MKQKSLDGLLKMTANDTKEVLELIKSALTNKNTRQLGEALVTLTELEPNRWITLLHLNNVIPDADQKTAELAKILPILLESLPYAIADPVFPIDGFTNLLLPLLTLNTSFSSISESLDNLSIWEEPVINLIARIIGFLEDQTDVGFERSKKITGKNGYHDFRFLLSDEIDTIFDGPSTNVVAGYEEHCENLQLIVAYSIYQYSSGYWGEIEINRTPYEDSEFAKLVTLASIWRRYKDLWAKTKYFGWHAIKIEGVENSILFVPTDEEEQIRFEVGGIRAQYIFSEISSYSLSVGLDQQFSDTPNIFSELANSINLPQAGKPWNIELDPRAFREVTSNPWNKFYWENIFRVSHYQKIINWVWIGSKEKQIQWLVYWNLINVLRIIAGILHIHLRNTFPNFDSQSPLHKIILIEVKSLADFFSKTTKYDRETCLKFIDLITFNPSLRYIEIWDTPLIKAGKDLLFFSPALISNGNPVRAAENFISEWNPSLFDKRGKLLEQELLEYLLDVPELKVQQAVKFRNDKFQEIECDLVVWWENTLLLIEVKCRKSIYYPYDAFQAKQQIQKAVDQLVSRRAAVLNSWTSFSNAACDLQLPKEAAKDIKLIAVTNNPHFTGWQIHDVIVTDVFCLKRYFSKNEIAAYVNGETIATVGYIRGSMKPTVKDFFSYLIEPPQVQVVRNGLKIDPLFLPVVKETDPIISSFHMSYTPKSYDIDVKTKKYPPASGKKARRNDPCPCGSGLKYKKCCGSKR